jgi:tRNA A-37 threonylcarbamoyl transferase component Bud32
LQHSRVAALEVWARERTRLTAALASSERVRSLTDLALGAEDAEARMRAAQDLEREIGPTVGRFGLLGFVILDPQGHGFSSYEGQVRAVRVPLAQLPGVDQAFEGRELLGRPILLEAQNASLGGPSAMFAWCPLKGSQGEVSSVFGLRINQATNFARLLNSTDVRGADSIESYAFDDKGTMLSASRFEPELHALGLLPQGTSSALHVSLRDPGADLREGEKPELVREAQPLTLNVRSAIAKLDGMDLTGYRGYRGVPVVGAWTWLSNLGMGVATELAVRDAYAAMEPVRWGLRGLLACLVVAALCAYFFVMRAKNLEQTVEEAAQLGRYRLGKRLGKGGMGEVYEAEHSLLARRAAIKLLKVDVEQPDMKERFEREARCTARLIHPNTIAVYDFGTSPEGMFYYAMEYIDGINLDKLLTTSGPLSVSRTLHILLQVAGSLAEAHEAGLLHRDIKPANVMLSLRAGIPDFVKVLDFGLVRSIIDATVKLTGEHEMLGTPAYMAPEAMTRAQPVDQRADVYAVGAVAYFLLTAEDAFSGEGVTEIIANRLMGNYKPLEEHNPDLPSALRALVHACLSESPEKRPETMRVLIQELERIQALYPFDRDQALLWWRALETTDSKASAPSATSISGVAATLARPG